MVFYTYKCRIYADFSVSSHTAADTYFRCIKLSNTRFSPAAIKKQTYKADQIRPFCPSCTAIAYELHDYKTRNVGV